MVEYGITETGYLAKPYDVIEANARARILGVAGQAFDLSPTVPMGAMHANLCAELATLWQHSKQSYDGTDRLAAMGQQIVNQGKLIGAYLKPAAKGSVVETVTHKWPTGTRIEPGAILISRRGDATNTWTNRDPIEVASMTIVSGTIQPADVDVFFESVQASALAVGPANSLTEIIGSVTDLISVYNAHDATPGRDAETPDELRIRLEVEQEGSAVTTLGALRADLNAIPTIIKALVASNRSDVYVDGIRPRAIRVVIWDGDPAQTPDALIADTIFRHLDGGTDTEGSIVQQVADTDGQLVTVRFDRCAVLRPWISLKAYGGIAESVVKESIATNAQPLPQESLKISAINAAVLKAGCYDVSHILVGAADPAASSENLPPIYNGIVLIDTSQITVEILP
jgi:hypothetical protein